MTWLEKFWALILEALKNIKARGHRAKRVYFIIKGVLYSGEGDIMYILPDDQQVAVTVAFVDKKGNPAAVDGIPTWASSDETIVALTANADGMGANLVAGATGSCQISVTGDADLGVGVVPVVGTLDVQVVAGAAVTAIITPGTPQPQ